MSSEIELRTSGFVRLVAKAASHSWLKKEGQPGFGINRMDFKKIWKSRAGERDDSFVEERRSRFADAILEQIERIKVERQAATDKRGFDHRLKMLGRALAALDGKRSVKLILELMELPGRWDGWTSRKSRGRLSCREVTRSCVTP